MRLTSSHPRVLLVATAVLTLSAQVAWAGQRDAVPTGDSASSPTSLGSASDALAMEVQGYERLVWDQPASSASELAGLGFVAYVNGRRQRLGSVSCASQAGPDGFECTSVLPSLVAGVQVIEIAAQATAGPRVEGHRSAPLHVRFGDEAPSGVAVADVRDSPLADDVADPGSSADVREPSAGAPSMERRWTTSDGVRLRAAAVSTGLEDPTDLLPLPDGRVLVAERAGRVRVIRDGVMLAAAAVTLDDVAVGDGRGLLAIALDRDFASTRHVFATYTTDDGLRVVRFTAVGDRLVDHAVLLEGLPVAAVQPAALVRSGPDGRLYVALDDGGDRQRVHDMGSYSGKVLRFATDGTTPDDQRGRSPVWSVGVSHPVGLAWTGERATLRLIGVESHDVARPQSSSPTSVDSDSGVMRFSLTPDIGASRAAIASGPDVPAFRDNLLVASAAGRAILRIWFASGDVPGGSEWLLRDLPGPVTALAVAPDGAIYAAVGSVLLRIGGE